MFTLYLAPSHCVTYIENFVLVTYYISNYLTCILLSQLMSYQINKKIAGPSIIVLSRKPLNSHIPIVKSFISSHIRINYFHRQYIKLIKHD